MPSPPDTTPPASRAPEPPLQRSDLRAVFEQGFKPPEAFGIGVEYERFGVLRNSQPPGAPLPLEGPASIGSVFDALVAERGWKPGQEEGRTIELARGDSRITLEPGLQMELSGAVHRGLPQLAAELMSYLAEVKGISDPLGIVWLAAGTHPTAGLDVIPWLPKQRYAIMREALPARGRLAHAMMKGTCGNQINLDFSDEADAMAKLRVAMMLTSVVTAVFANSPVTAGRINGMRSERAAIWLETDPDRSGLLPFSLDRSASFDDYVDWALGVPMLFLTREGGLFPVRGVSFGRFLESGLDGERATRKDWETHLSTLFPDVRLKGYIEVRGTDSNAPGLVLAHAALWKGILYGGGEILEEAEALFDGLSVEDHRRLRVEVPRLGLSARARRRTTLVLAREMVRLAGAGLAARGEPGEDAFLDPLRDLILDRGVSPADELLARLSGQAPDPDVLIDHLSRLDGAS